MHRSPFGLPLIALLTLTLGACGTVQDSHTFRTYEEDGVVHAVNTGGPITGGISSGWRRC
ncbi:MAG: hypothetical protein R6W82_05140 [bacterium]